MIQFLQVKTDTIRNSRPVNHGKKSNKYLCIQATVKTFLRQLQTWLELKNSKFQWTNKTTVTLKTTQNSCPKPIFSITHKI